MDRLHIHQILDLLHPLVGNTGTLADQLLVVFDLDFSSVTADHQIIIFSPLIGKLDVKSKILIISFSIINLADIVSPGGHIAEFHRLSFPVSHLEFRHRFRRFSDDPAI